MRFRKDSAARWLGHLDLIRVFERALRVSGADIAYTEGFNPRVKMSIAVALPLAATASNEALTVTVRQPVDLKQMVSKLNAVLPDGISMNSAELLPEGVRTPVAKASEFKLLLRLPGETDAKKLDRSVMDILARESLPRARRSQQSTRLFDLRPGIEELSVAEVGTDGTARVRALLTHREFTVKPSEIFELLREEIEGLELISVHRSDLVLERPLLRDSKSRTSNSDIRPPTSVSKGGERICQKR